MDPPSIATRRNSVTSSHRSNRGARSGSKRRRTSFASNRTPERKEASSRNNLKRGIRSSRSSGSSSAATKTKAMKSTHRQKQQRQKQWAAASLSSSSLLSPPSSHVLCAIGENLARETCVVSLDLSAPFLLTATKQSNGQSYSETVACLSVLCPHEVLMNEGRYHSPLARKVVGHFDLKNQQQNQKQQNHQDENRKGSKEPSDDEETIVKFISRSYFDQTKGADLLKKLARQDTYDSTLVDEYILLSSSHAILHYAQITLGAVSFARHSLDVRVHTGGHNHHKMEIDRSTLLQLELLTNNNSGGGGSSSSSSSSNRKHSLIATMDRTKTGVGHRLLRTTLMAPPCRYVKPVF